MKSVFTNLRYVLVGIITETVDANPRYLDSIPEDLWVMLCSWFFCFSGYNVYHGLFYRLVFNALRSNHARSLEALLSKARLLDGLLDAYSTGEKVSWPPVPRCRVPIEKCGRCDEGLSRENLHDGGTWPFESTDRTLRLGVGVVPSTFCCHRRAVHPFLTLIWVSHIVFSEDNKPEPGRLRDQSPLWRRLCLSRGWRSLSISTC